MRSVSYSICAEDLSRDTTGLPAGNQPSNVWPRTASQVSYIFRIIRIASQADVILFEFSLLLDGPMTQMFQFVIINGCRLVAVIITDYP